MVVTSGKGRKIPLGLGCLAAGRRGGRECVEASNRRCPAVLATREDGYWNRTKLGGAERSLEGDTRSDDSAGRTRQAGVEQEQYCTCFACLSG